MSETNRRRRKWVADLGNGFGEAAIENRGGIGNGDEAIREAQGENTTQKDSNGYGNSHPRLDVLSPATPHHCYHFFSLSYSVLLQTRDLRQMVDYATLVHLN